MWDGGRGRGGRGVGLQPGIASFFGWPSEAIELGGIFRTMYVDMAEDGPDSGRMMWDSAAVWVGDLLCMHCPPPPSLHHTQQPQTQQPPAAYIVSSYLPRWPNSQPKFPDTRATYRSGNACVQGKGGRGGRGGTGAGWGAGN